MADPNRPRRPEAIDVELDVLLDDLGHRIAFPPTPDIAAAVRRDLAARRSEPPRVVPRPAPPAWLRPDQAGGWRRLAAVAAIAIVFDDETPTPSATPVGLGLLLGEPVTIEDARARVDFPIAVPDLPDVGAPDEIYLRERPDGDMVSFLYRPRPGLPEAAESGVGLLLIQFEAPTDAMWGAKNVSDSNEVRVVTIGGIEGLWIGGTHQLMVYPDPVGGLRGASQPLSRTSANVLLWQSGGVTFRLESALTRDEAVAIAEQVVAGVTPSG